MGNAHLLKQEGTELQIGDFVIRPHVVNLAQLAAVEDGVEGIGRVAREEVAPGRGAIAMEDDRLVAVQEASKFGNDLCGGR